MRHTLHRHFSRFLIGLVLLLTVTALVFSWIVWPTYQKPAKAAFAKPSNHEQFVRQDLAYLREVMRVDRSFTPAEWAEFDRRVNSLETKAARLDGPALDMGVAWAMAAANEAHTNARGAVRGLTLNSLPIRFAWFSDGLYVVKAMDGYTDLLGGRVVQVGEHPVERAAEELLRFTGGTKAFAHQFTPFLLSSPQALHAAALSSEPSRAKFTFEIDGRQVQRTIKARPEPNVTSGNDGRPQRDLSPVPEATDERDWVHFIGDGAEVPLYLQRPNTPYWSRMLENPRALYVQMNTVRSEGEPPLPEFLETILSDVAGSSLEAVILDLRFNKGGNYMLVTDFARDLPAALKPGQKLFIITSTNTFSAGIVLVVHLKAWAGEQAIVVGEPVGDRLKHWGEGGRRNLPNSGLTVRYSTAFHNFRDGCSIQEIRKCFFLDYLFPYAHVDNVEPDLPAPLSFADYAGFRDPSIERIARYLEQNRAPEVNADLNKSP